MCVDIPSAQKKSLRHPALHYHLALGRPPRLPTRAGIRLSNVRLLASRPLGAGRRDDDVGTGKRSEEQWSSEKPARGGSEPKIYNILKALPKLGIEHENEKRAAARTDNTVPAAHGETEQTRATRGLHAQRNGGESGGELQSTPVEEETMFQGLLVRFTDLWTVELVGNLRGAAAPEQLLEGTRFLNNEGEKCKACQEGKNTYKAKRSSRVDMKDQPGTRWIICPARRDLAEAFQSPFAIEKHKHWLGLTFLQDFAPASQAAKVLMEFVRPSGRRSNGAANKVVSGRNKPLDGTRNSGQMAETEATHGGERRNNTALQCYCMPC